MLFWLLAGCEGGEGTPDAAALPITGLVLTVDTVLPTVVHAAWDAGPTGEAWLEYGENPEDLTRRTAAGTGITATAVALAEGRNWYFRAAAVDAEGARWESEPVSVGIASAPAALPRFTISDVSDADVDADALVFTSLLQEGTSWVVGLDRQGDYVWWWQSDGNIEVDSVHAAADGKGLVFTHFRLVERPYAGVVGVRFDGSSWATTWAADGHHDAAQLPSGEIAYIAGQRADAVSLEDGTTADLASDRLQLVAEGATSADTPETVFSFLDDYAHQPWRVCSHFDDETPGGGLNYTHANSVMVDPDRNTLLVQSKNIDALIAVNRESGAVLWQAGGRYSDVTDVDGDVIPTGEDAWMVEGPNGTWWSHGHMSHFWGDGFAMFDNGYHHPDQVSRAVAYALDQDKRTIEKVWEFRSETDSFNPLLGDVRRLSSGNYLISWTIQGMITEITADARVVWRASVALGAATGRLVYVTDVYGGTPPQ